MLKRSITPKTTSPAVPQVSEGKDVKQEWEYEVLSLVGSETREMKEKLNELGVQGWLLVATTPVFIFRRPKLGEPEHFQGPIGFLGNRDG
ncbi:MAG: hypothetical protein HY692_10200 [Cyanobacteria bacterium NC_groundwater_1444_Ag_S-0.65um_54_12]|nr:hypothetical protein [Cyanobacteria bacterium NC_groundwater_1444_Ag_S-0.65um_54_12]